MAKVFKDFDGYTIQHFSGTSVNDVMINCYKGPVPSNFPSSPVGRLVFFRDSIPLPKNQDHEWGPEINYPLSRYMEIISTLREEKPLRLFFDTINLTGGLATGSVTTFSVEAVGEEEGK